MTLTFPLSLNTFADKLKIRNVQWELKRWDEISGLGSGDVLAAQLAPPRWSGVVSLAAMSDSDAAEVQAFIESLDGPINSFFLFAPQRMYPQFDPDGIKLGSSVVKIKSLGSNNKSLSFKGLPQGYKLTIGDMFSYSYGSNPSRQALHRILESTTANVIGEISEFEIRPHLRPGVTTDIVVTLKKPFAKVFIIPGTFSPGVSSSGITDGMQFEVMQRP